MSNQKDYTVRATHCSHQASPDEIYDRLVEINRALAPVVAKIEKARRIGIKINMQMRTNSIRRIGGRRQELVDDDVMRAVLRLLRERSDAKSSRSIPASRLRASALATISTLGRSWRNSASNTSRLATRPLSTTKCLAAGSCFRVSALGRLG